MLTKIEFDENIKWFEEEFDHKLTEGRKKILFQNMFYLDPVELNDALIKVVEQYNRDTMPTIKEIATIAYDTCPVNKRPDPKRYDLNIDSKNVLIPNFNAG